VRHANRLRTQQQQQNRLLPSSPETAEGDKSTTGPSARVKLKFVKEAFRVLQLMCEGHHLELQNYVREQTDDLHPINVLKDITALMHQLCVFIDTHNLSVGTQGFALLAEFPRAVQREPARSWQTERCWCVAHLNSALGSRRTLTCSKARQPQPCLQRYASRPVQVPLGSVAEQLQLLSGALLHDDAALEENPLCVQEPDGAGQGPAAMDRGPFDAWQETE
jgi:hypothetical protein